MNNNGKEAGGQGGSSGCDGTRFGKQTSHRQSVAWQKAMKVTADIYGVTSRFPSEERFGLTNQLRRAAVSIASNIAEGKGRTTLGELIQFLGIARGSVLEVQTQLEIATMLGFAPEDELSKLYDQADEVGRILSASITTMKKRLNEARSGKAPR